MLSETEKGELRIYPRNQTQKQTRTLESRSKRKCAKHAVGNSPRMRRVVNIDQKQKRVNKHGKWGKSLHVLRKISDCGWIPD